MSEAQRIADSLSEAQELAILVVAEHPIPTYSQLWWHKDALTTTMRLGLTERIGTNESWTPALTPLGREVANYIYQKQKE